MDNMTLSDALKKRAAAKKAGTWHGFDSLVAKLQAEGKSPEAAKAIAATIGRKKFGQRDFAALAQHGRKS